VGVCDHYSIYMSVDDMSGCIFIALIYITWMHLYCIYQITSGGLLQPARCGPVMHEGMAAVAAELPAYDRCHGSAVRHVLRMHVQGLTLLTAVAV